MLVRAFSALLVLAACVSCDRTRNITVEFYSEDGYRFSQAERDTIEDIADATIPEVRKFLPALPNDLTLKVYPGKDVIPETGETGSLRTRTACSGSSARIGLKASSPSRNANCAAPSFTSCIISSARRRRTRSH